MWSSLVLNPHFNHFLPMTKLTPFPSSVLLPTPGADSPGLGGPTNRLLGTGYCLCGADVPPRPAPGGNWPPCPVTGDSDAVDWSGDQLP